MRNNFFLKKKWHFQEIIKTGKKINDPNFIIFFKKTSEFKIGISIPKKLGNAVYRNKNKRQIKNILFQIIDSSNTSNSIILIAKKDFINRNFEEKKKILEAIFLKLSKI